MKIEDMKNVLKDEYNKISKDLDGKTEEELESMLNEARIQEANNRTKEASEYIFNIMNLGKEFSEEAYLKVIQDINEKNSTEEKIQEYAKEHYSKFGENESLTGLRIIEMGYKNFGKKFIAQVLENDLDSAKMLFELICQQYINIVDEINYISQNAEAIIKENKKESKEESKKEN